MSEEKESKMADSSRLTLQIAGAAIFGALSIVLSFLAAIIPRSQFGIAYFDPVSLIWVLCYLIFGPLAGVLCCIIGMVALMPFDPWAPLGPLMKFAATISLILPGIILLKLYKTVDGDRKSQTLKEPKTYAMYGLIGIGVRLAVMVTLNIMVFMAFGYPMALMGFFLIEVILLNLLQSTIDLVVPYLIVFKGGLDEKFEIW